MGSLFRLPDELILSPLFEAFPGRDDQIRSLASLLSPDAILCRNIVVHGAEATGKTTVLASLLERLAQHYQNHQEQQEEDIDGGALRYARVDAAQCITARHLYERIVGEMAAATATQRVAQTTTTTRCETLAQLAVYVAGFLTRDGVDGDGDGRHRRRRFVLVLDSIDKQRDAPPTLLPALARLSEMIPSLTCVFVVTSPTAASLLRSSGALSLYFSPYTKQDFVRILALSPPTEPVRGTTRAETVELWTRFCAAVHDALVRAASRTLPAFRDCCRTLWPRFTAPIVARSLEARDFSKLLVAARAALRDETVLNPSIIAVRRPTGSAGTEDGDGGGGSLVAARTSNTTTTTATTTTTTTTTTTELTALLPTMARLLLLAAYLAGHNASKHDLTLFSTFYHGRKRRRRGGGGGRGGRHAKNSSSKHGKIARKLLGSHAFVLERMMAIFEAVRAEWLDGGAGGGGGGGCGGGEMGIDGDVGMALATLASLRLLVRVGSGDILDRAGRWRIALGWETVRSVGRSIGVEVEEWLIE